MSDAFKFAEKELSFIANNNVLDGILTIPASGDLFPAVILLHGSDRSGKDDPYYQKHAENLVQSGFAVLRYDGPGWGGRSSESAGFETLEYRMEEAIAALKYLQTRSEILADRIGLWGLSQGGWICQMAAAQIPDVAFIIPVSGPGVRPAEQEVYRVEAQSKAAGFDPDEVAKAVLLRRLMVDVIADKPAYQTINQTESLRLGNGPWCKIEQIVYAPDPVDPQVEHLNIIASLNALKNEPWTMALHLDQVLPMLENMPPQAWETAKSQMRAVQEVDPAKFLTRVKCPVLAIFGEDDTSIPVQKSVTLYKKYLAEAGNESVVIEVFPNASHTIHIGDDFAPGYFETISEWLSLRNHGVCPG